MGCDIHLAAEVRKNGKWTRAFPPPEARDPWLLKRAAEFPDDAHYQRRVEVTWYDDRDYNVFAILAGVRNYCDFTPIADPKGLPRDMSQEVQALADGADENDVSLGEHSQSWLTLAELLAHDWNAQTTESGCVAWDSWKQWRDAGFPSRGPKQWCRGVGGGMVRHITDEQARVQLWGPPSTEHVYVDTSWTRTDAEHAEPFVTRVLPALEKLGRPEDVRIVFGFDS